MSKPSNNVLEQPFKSSYSAGLAAYCKHCNRMLPTRGSWDVEIVSWSYKSDYKPDPKRSGTLFTDKEYCTKACAIKARKPAKPLKDIEYNEIETIEEYGEIRTLTCPVRCF